MPLTKNKGSTYIGANDNLIINGDMSIWQRGTSFSPGVGVSTYTADRWICIPSGVSTPVSRVANPTAGGLYSIRADGVAGNTLCAFRQRIESANSVSMEGEESVLSFRIRGTVTNGQIRIWTADTADNFTNITLRHTDTFAITSGFSRVSLVIPNITSVSTGIQVSIEAATGIPAGGYIELNDVKLEKGSQATPFVTASRAGIGGELALCQRYFTKINSDETGTTRGFGLVQVSSTTSRQGRIPIYCEMRAVPTITNFGVDLDMAVGGGEAINNITAAGRNGGIAITGQPGLGSGTVGTVRVSAGTYMWFDAEL